MFARLTIADPRERTLVGVADLALSIVAAVGRPFRRAAGPAVPSRILLLRLERIGDLLMSMEAIARVREAAPEARIDLVVGSWNAELAALLPGPTRVETLDVPWLARGAAGASARDMLARALEWRRRRYDLVVNFEGDIRSNLLAGLTGAPRRVGFGLAGGAPLLTEVVEHDARAYTGTNSLALVSRAFDRQGPPPGTPVGLRVPDAARATASTLLGPRPHPWVGVHASGGRPVKQWNPDRFAAVSARLQQEAGATIVLTGGPADRGVVDEVKAGLDPAKTVDLCGAVDLPSLAAVLERLDVLVTGDTGPMHLAAAVGTPVLAVFGPSDPARYAPSRATVHVVRIDLPCSPCNRIRQPPERCVGHVPDCLAGITVDEVTAAARRALAGPGDRSGQAGQPVGREAR